MRSGAQDDLEGVLHVSMDDGLFGEKESEEQVTLVLVFRQRRHQMTWAMLVPRKETEFPWIGKRAARFIDQLLARETAQARQEGCQIVPERPPVGEPVQRNHRTHGGTRGRSGHRIGVTVTLDTWIPC